MLFKVPLRANILLFGLLGFSELSPKQASMTKLVSQLRDPHFFCFIGSSIEIVFNPFVTEICFLAMNICVPISF